MTVDGHSESVKVIVRCRPFNQREKDLRCKSVVSMDGGRGEVSISNPHDEVAPPKTFTFDGVYDVDSITEQIYTDIAYPLVEANIGVLEAYAGTVFAYGQTGCGKSFTMQGAGAINASTASALDDPQRGIVPRAFEHIFEAIATSDDTKYLVQASYLEIYNEEIRDLLGKDTKRRLELKDHPKLGAFIPGLSTHAVHDVGTMLHLMTIGWRNRSVGSTLMNADSSRSHSVFTVSLEMMPIDGGEPTKGKLNLVDLAGSERQTKTGCTGDRLKEATKINLSLSALGNVISALVDGKSKHIPYRDSKLTRLLQDSLGGETRTLMIACLSPADNNYDESLSTLRYANRAKKIVNKPVKNENPVDALLREYQEEIRRLKAIVDGGGHGSSSSVDRPPALVGDDQSLAPDSNKLEEEKNRLKMEYEQMMEELRVKYEREQLNHAKLQKELNLLREHYEEQMQRLNVTGADNIPKSESGDIGLVKQEMAAESNNGTVSVGRSSTSPPEKPEIELNNALKRLQELEEQMVGGEKAHDKELKEKRLRKKKAAEKRLRILADALQQVDEDDKVLITVYEDIQEELKAKTELLKKEKQRVRTLEREIKDLQSEFEFDRMDYLETIRRQDQQSRLLQQILDKVQPCLRRDCNYSSVERVKAESTWDEDAQRWILPDLVVAKTRLPAAAAAATTSTIQQATPRRRIEQGGSASDHPNGDGDDQDDADDKFLQKLERGEQENIAGNYFRPKRAKELLLKAQEESVSRGVRLSNLRNNNGSGGGGGVMNTGGRVTGGGGGGGFLYNAVLNASNQNCSSNFDSIPYASSTSPPSMENGHVGGAGGGGRRVGKVGVRSGPTSPEIVGLIRKPTRLDALDPMLTGNMADIGTTLSKKLAKRKTPNQQNMNFVQPGTTSALEL